MGFVNDISNMLDPKTIDHQRNITLRLHGGGGTDGVHRFELDWQNNIIRFEARVNHSRLVKEPTPTTYAKFEFCWEVRAIVAPSEFLAKNSRESICETITEVMQIYGECFDDARVERLDVVFLPNVFEREVVWRLL